MLILHHLKNSRSQRIIWLLEELDLTYEIVEHNHDFRKDTIQSLLSVHPLGKAPVLVDGEITLAETAAIIEYLLEIYSNGRLQPARGTRERINYIYWKNFAESSFMQYLVVKLVFANVVARTPFFARFITSMISSLVNAKYLDPNIKLGLDHIEHHLQNNLWFSGNEFSATDITIGFMLEAVAGRMASDIKYPYLNSFVERIKLRPSYQRAAARGKWSVAEHDKYWKFLSAHKSVC